MANHTQLKPSTLSQRKRAKAQSEQGFKRMSLALSPKAVEIVERVKASKGFTSREAAINAILERIADDMFMRQEFAAVST